MMKAHGIAPNAASVKAPPAARAFKTERKEVKGTSKKRKMDAFADDQGATDDDESFPNIKSDPVDGSELLVVKEEASHQAQFNESNNMMQFLPHLDGDDDGYTSGGSIYEPATTGFSTPIEHAYAPRSTQHYGNFAVFGESDIEEPQTPASQISHHKPQSIIIGD